MGRLSFVIAIGMTSSLCNMKGSASSMWPITIWSFGYFSNTPPRMSLMT